jgi:hypothetical protein
MRFLHAEIVPPERAAVNGEAGRIRLDQHSDAPEVRNVVLVQ